MYETIYVYAAAKLCVAYGLAALFTLVAAMIGMLYIDTGKRSFIRQQLLHCASNHKAFRIERRDSSYRSGWQKSAAVVFADSNHRAATATRQAPHKRRARCYNKR